MIDRFYLEVSHFEPSKNAWSAWDMFPRLYESIHAARWGAESLQIGCEKHGVTMRVRIVHVTEDSVRVEV